jgi:hypothetical protein
MRLLYCLAMLLLTSCRFTAGYQPPPIPPESRCYRFYFSEWSPGATRGDIAWFMPPDTVALTPLPAFHPGSPDWLRVLLAAELGVSQTARNGALVVES